MAVDGSVTDGAGSRPVSPERPARPQRGMIGPLDDIPEGYVDYKNVAFLSRCLSEGGRIVPSRVTGVSYKRQRSIRTALLRARMIGLLPYVRK